MSASETLRYPEGVLALHDAADVAGADEAISRDGRRRRMTITSLFKQLGAPLRNHVWSWGAVSPTGRLYLRVWEDRIIATGEVKRVQLTHHAGSTDSHGWGERRDHVERIRRNHSMPVLCIVCTASDPKATPRTIGGFDRNIILRGYGDGLYEDHFGNVWLKTTPEPLAPHLKRRGASPKPRLVNARD